MKFFLLLFIACSILNVHAQSNFGNEWITGAGGQRIKFDFGNIQTSNSVFYNTYFMVGNSSICDSSGKLILCSDGFNIYGNNGSYIQDGDSIVPNYFYTIQNGWSAYSESSIFLPFDSNKYYFITPTFSDSAYNECHNNGGNCLFDLLLYNIIDMNANAGAGKVTQRMQLLMEHAQLSRTQMMACRHSNGKDWWLLKQGGDSNKVYKFLFTQDSIINYGLQTFTTPVWGLNNIHGQSVFRFDGNQYATTVQGYSTGEIFISEFDRCYGILSNPQIIIMPEGSQHIPSDTTITEREPRGLAYSPNGKLLYAISRSNIWQYDIEHSGWYHVAGLDTSYLRFQTYSAAYLGPDNKLYIGNWGGTSKQMSVINQPDLVGAACDFCPRCLRLDSLGSMAYVGTPPCIPNYNLGAQACWPLGVSNQQQNETENLIVFPNPANEKITLKFSTIQTEKNDIEIYNNLGQLVKKGVIISNMNQLLDCSILPKGFYIVRVKNSVVKLMKE